MFGPYAGFSTKFLKHGSLLDLFMSIRPRNIVPLMEVGLHNFDLTEYLVEQVVQSPKDRFATLTIFYPRAEQKDWKLEVASMRVQIIKRDPKKGGVLKFGTETVAAQECSLVARLGASPGASTAAAIMIKVLELCFGISSIAAGRPSCSRSFRPTGIR
jgi:malate dehydrogenase (quinone)